jgi:hypothetical protein
MKNDIKRGIINSHTEIFHCEIWRACAVSYKEFIHANNREHMSDGNV